MLVPLLNKLVRLVTIFHALPLQQLLALRLLPYTVENRSHDEHESEEARRRDLVAVQNAGETDAQQDSSRHNQSKYHRSKVFDCVEDEQLKGRRENGRRLKATTRASARTCPTVEHRLNNKKCK